MKVLVLEDSVYAYNVQERILKKNNFEVFHAANSTNFFDLLREGLKPDLFILDIELEKEIDPNVNIDGLDVAKKLLAINPVPIVLLTNHYKEEKYYDRARKLNIPAKYFLPKDRLENPEAFIKTLEEAVEDFKTTEQISIDNYAALSKRKIGILMDNKIYQFYKKDDIVYLEADSGLTWFHFSDRSKASITTTLSRVETQVVSVFSNFMRIDSKYCINLEKIKILEGKTLFFDDGLNIPLSDAGRLKLKRNNLIIRTRP